MLLAARASKVDRVVYSSSASVYGNPRSIPINEDDPLWTLSPYAVSKLGGENYCTAFSESYGLRVATVRYSNVYGPGQRPDNPYCGVVSKFLVEAHAGRPITIHGDGEQTRDYTYIDDAVEATLLAAVHPRAEGEVFNVGTGIETSVNRLAASIGEALERRDRPSPRRPPRHRQHPPARRQHREDPPDAALDAAVDARPRSGRDRELVQGVVVRGGR